MDRTDSRSRCLSKRLDLTFIGSVFVIFFVFSSVPYLYGYLSCPADKKFVGLVGWDVAGSYMYRMWQRQAAEGAVLLENRLTPERHAPFYFNLEWLLLGRLLKFSGLSSSAAFQLERGLTLLAAFAAVYYLLTCFFADLTQRRLVFLWILLTSGFGWVFWLLEQVAGLSWQVRAWDLEGVNFFGYLLNKPHVIRSLALLCLAYALLLKGEQSGRRLYFGLAGGTILLQGFIRPYDLPTAALLLLLFPALLCLREGRRNYARVGNYLLAALAAAPIYIYYLVLQRRSVLKESFQAVDFPAFTPLELVVWLGLPLLLMVVAWDGLRSWRKCTPATLFLALWYLLTLALIYAYPLIPWGMESAGLCYIMAPIAAAGFLLREVLPRVAADGPGQRPAHRFAVTRAGLTVPVFVSLILLSLPSNLVLTGKLFVTLARHSRPYYLPTGVAAAFAWLERHAGPEQLVLSHPGNGYHLPVDAGVRAFVGHGHFTINYQQKVEQMLAFYNAATADAERRALLTSYAVDYVLFTDLERAAGTFDPAAAPYLTRVYDNAAAAVYRVLRERL